LQFQEDKQDQNSVTQIGNNSSIIINTENDDITEEQTEDININEKTLGNLPSTNFDKLFLIEKTSINQQNTSIDRSSLIEGIWSNDKNTYQIGIQRTERKGRYIAIILNSQEPTMKKGEGIAEFFNSKFGYIFPTKYYLEDKTKVITESYVDETGLLLIFLEKWGRKNLVFRRSYPKYDATEAQEKAKESIKEITRPQKERTLIKTKKEKNIIRVISDKKIENSNKLINKLKVDSKYASKTIYTIQTGSFMQAERAQKQFDSMLQILNGKKFNFLRIEKIGKYYSVRLGKFIDYNLAEQFMIAAKPELSNAVILSAYIKKERIIRMDE
jgi:hypothetical protein